MKLKKGYFNNAPIKKIYKGSTLFFADSSLDEIGENETWSLDKFEIKGWNIYLSQKGLKLRDKLGKENPINIDVIIAKFKDRIHSFKFPEGKVNSIDYAECTSNIVACGDIQIKCSYPNIKILSRLSIDAKYEIILPNCVEVADNSIILINNLIITAQKCEKISPTFIELSFNGRIKWTLAKGCKHGDLHGSVTYV